MMNMFTYKDVFFRLRKCPENFFTKSIPEWDLLMLTREGVEVVETWERTPDLYDVKEACDKALEKEQ